MVKIPVKFLALICGFLSLAFIFYVFIKNVVQIERTPSSSLDTGELQSAISDNVSETTGLKVRKRERPEEVVIMKIDRSSPQVAFDTVINSLKGLDFEEYYECFSEHGKNVLCGGNPPTVEGIKRMSEALKVAEFQSVRVVDVDIRASDTKAEVNGLIESKRNGKIRKENLVVEFENFSGVWLINIFEVLPYTEK